MSNLFHDLNALANRVHAANRHWWLNPATGEPVTANFGEKMMLAISELSEGLEGHRKNLKDDHLPNRPMLEVELADFIIRLLDSAGGFGLELPITRGRLSSSNVGQRLFEITQVLCNARSVLHDAASSVSLAIEEAILLAQDQELDLEGAFEGKLAYNAQRADHKNEARLAPGGKAY